MRLHTVAQLVEHRTGIAEVMGSNPVGASEFLLGFLCYCFSCFITAITFSSINVSFTIVHVCDIDLVPQFTFLVPWETRQDCWLIFSFILHWLFCLWAPEENARSSSRLSVVLFHFSIYLLFSPMVQFQLLHSTFPLCSSATRGLLLSTYIKFINLFPEIKPHIQEVRVWWEYVCVNCMKIRSALMFYSCGKITKLTEYCQIPLISCLL